MLERVGDVMSNPLRPDQMTAAERITEVADILADGLLRAKLRDMRKAISRRKIRGNTLDKFGGLRPHVLEPQADGESP